MHNTQIKSISPIMMCHLKGITITNIRRTYYTYTIYEYNTIRKCDKSPNTTTSQRIIILDIILFYLLEFVYSVLTKSCVHYFSLKVDGMLWSGFDTIYDVRNIGVCMRIIETVQNAKVFFRKFADPNDKRTS